jgi:hypothetical protein
VIKNRWPEVGNLLIVKEKSSGKEYHGVIHKIENDPNRGLRGNVYITWAGDVPHAYYPKYGYSAVNIHNCFNEFELVK